MESGRFLGSAWLYPPSADMQSRLVHSTCVIPQLTCNWDFYDFDERTESVPNRVLNPVRVTFCSHLRTTSQKVPTRVLSLQGMFGLLICLLWQVLKSPPQLSQNWFVGDRKELWRWFGEGGLWNALPQSSLWQSDFFAECLNVYRAHTKTWSTRGQKEAVLSRKEQSYDDVIKALEKRSISFAEDQKQKTRGFGECMTLPFQCWHAKPLGAFDLRDSAIDMQLRLLWLWWTDRISSKPGVKSC